MSENESLLNEPIEVKADSSESEIKEAAETNHEVSTDAEPSSNSMQDLKERLQKAEEQAKENYDRFLRASAELENFKKRTARETENFRKYANEAILRELLPVVDSLERAIASYADAANMDNAIQEGVHLTLKEILRVLDRSGVKPIEAAGKPFDPNFHEAMMQKESDEVADNTVIQEYQKGYLLYDRLLRPAMVVVSKAVKKESDIKNNEEE